MAENATQRKLAAIMHADVKGYSRLMGENESHTVSALKECRQLFAESIHNHGGRVVNAPGDSILTEFPSVVSAVQCAVEIQNQLNARNAELPDNREMVFRIGVNLGDVIQSEKAIYGDGVNIAARIEALAEPGGVSISRTVFNQVRNKLPFGYEYQGEHQVKNITNPVKVYKLLTAPEDAGKLVGMEPAVSASKWIWPTVVVAAVIVTLIGYHVHQEIAGLKVEPASVEKMAFALPEKPSVAVLPFDNMSGDPDQIYIADGISENIIAALSKIPELFVISRNSTFKYKGNPAKVRQIAEDLGVRYVLEGSMQKFDERLRVTAQLIDALKGYHVWSEKYDRKLDQFFSVQDDIALNIAVSLQVKLTEGEQARVRHSTENLEAWSLAVKAHGLFETYAREDIAKARELFKKSVELDPNYAYAWSYLGWTYWIDGIYYSAFYDRKKSIERATEMAEKALSIDGKSSDAHALLSGVYLAQQKYDEAVAAGEKTIKLDPNSSENYAIVAITMQNAGKFEEAIALVKQAMRLDPYFPNWYLGRLGMCYQMMGRYEESAEAFEELAKRYRQSGSKAPLDRLYLYLASTYSMMGRLDEAQDLVSKALEFNPKMTAEHWRKRFQYKDPKHTERIIDALRRVGLPD